MTYYPDFSPYEYLKKTVPDGITALNIGWLDDKHPFNVGDSPKEFIEELALLCRGHRHAQTRGIHPCYLEPRTEDWEPVYVYIGEKKQLLGAAEVRVVSLTGAWLIAPTLVYHYVTSHRYLPPEEFVEAVMVCRIVGDG